MRILVQPQSDGTFNAIEQEPRLRDVAGSGRSAKEAVASLFDYYAELVRTGSVSVEEVLACS